MASSQPATHGRFSPFSTPSATRAVLERHGLYTKYALGQNFLVNDDVVRKILELADVQPTDHVLEVGPGIGTLSAALLQRAGHLTAIEMDADLPKVLADTLAPWTERFTLLEMDALDVPSDAFAMSAPLLVEETDVREHAETADEVPAVPPYPTKLVSNLPYAVAATVVLDYLQRFACLQSATVMVQKEVADRMMAKPSTKEYGAYTVKLSLFAEPTGRFSVAPGNFFPPPHVESAVIRLNRRPVRADDGHVLDAAELAATCTMADAAFATRRKTLANSCKTYFSGKGDAGKALAVGLPGLFAEAGIDPRRRGETFDQAEFVRLGLALHASGAGLQ